MARAAATTLPVTATGVVFNGQCTLRGFSISSTAGADVVIYDNGSAASGTILAQFTLAAKGWAFADINDGVRCMNGIYISTTGALQGHVRVG